MSARLMKAVASAPAVGVALFLFSAGFPPLDDAAEVDLTIHMFQHILIVLAGFTVAYPIVGRRITAFGRAARLAPPALLGTAALIVFWHLPYPWDSAVTDPALHVVEHVSFFGIGLLSGSVLMCLSDTGKIGALLAAFFGHMGYAVALVSPWHIQIYALYSLGDQAILGWVLLLTGPFFLVGVAYLLAANPSWLSGWSGSGTINPGRRRPFGTPQVPRWIALLLVAFLIASSVGYFAYAGFAVSQQSVHANGPVVYIEETPVSWQYTPRNISVVLGVNSTVTWVSRSLSFDSVTEKGGGFSSGPIGPGQTFSYSFASPGVYSYYCRYHPWMTGNVVVLQRE